MLSLHEYLSGGALPFVHYLAQTSYYELEPNQCSERLLIENLGTSAAEASMPMRRSLAEVKQHGEKHLCIFLIKLFLCLARVSKKVGN